GEQLRVVVTIPGLGLATAGVLLASLPLDRLQTARQAAAYVGLCPQERTSGSSIRGHGHLGPLGPASVRKAPGICQPSSPYAAILYCMPSPSGCAPRASVPRSSSPPSCASYSSWPGHWYAPVNPSRQLTTSSSRVLDSQDGIRYSLEAW